MTIFANNVAGTLAANIGPSDTLLLLGPGQGAAFPSPGSDYFYATIVHIATGLFEVVKCTARSGDTLTIERGRDGTNAISFTTGSVVEMRLTAIMLREIDWRTVRAQPNGLAPLGVDGKIPDTHQSANVPLLAGGLLNVAWIPASIARVADYQAWAVPRTGGSFAASFTFDYVRVGTGPSNGRLDIGDDALLLDVGVANTVGIRGQTANNTGYILFGHDGAAFGFNGSSLVYGGQPVWTGFNFNPGSKLNQLNPAASGTLSVEFNMYTGHSIASGGNHYFFGSIGSGVYLNWNGTAYNFVNGWVYAPNFVGTSDDRLKDHLELRDLNLALPDLIQLWNWEWKDGSGPGTGVRAQAVREYAPQHVYESDDKLGVDKAGLALEAVVSLTARVRMLENERGSRR